MAEHDVDQRNYEAAIGHYKEALTFDPDDEEALCALARYMYRSRHYEWQFNRS